MHCNINTTFPVACSFLHFSDVRPFTFRFNRRTSKTRGLLFYRLIWQAARTAHIATDALMLDTGRGRAGHRRATRGDADHNRLGQVE
jgi:hypothetical protein